MSDLSDRITASRLAAMNAAPRPKSIVNRRGGNVYDMFLYGLVGFEQFGGTSAASFVDELKNMGDAKEINLHINSPGGDVFDGLAMYHQLARHPAKKNIVVDGEASSIASVVAMAGDHIKMAPHAQMMIHDARTLKAGGTAEDLRKMADELDTTTKTICDIYMRRTGMAEEDCRKLMTSETTMTAQQAVDMKFADEVEELPQRQAALAEPKIVLKPMSQLDLALLQVRLADLQRK